MDYGKHYNIWNNFETQAIHQPCFITCIMSKPEIDGLVQDWYFLYFSNDDSTVL